MVSIPGYSSNGSSLPYTSCVLTNRSQAASTTNSCPSIGSPYHATLTAAPRRSRDSSGPRAACGRLLSGAR